MISQKEIRANMQIICGIQVAQIICKYLLMLLLKKKKNKTKPAFFFPAGDLSWQVHLGYKNSNKGRIQSTKENYT